jgi:hypothetical protein
MGGTDKEYLLPLFYLTKSAATKKLTKNQKGGMEGMGC